MNLIEITCPYCWQRIEIEEPTYNEQPVEFVTDCEVCCRPIAVSAAWDDPEGPPEIDVDVEA